MARTLDEIADEVLKLPEDDRARLMSRLMSSFHEVSEDAEIAQVWIEEAAWRDQAMDEGEPGIPAEEVFRSIRASLR